MTGVVQKVSRSQKESFKPGDLGSEKTETSFKAAVIDVGTKNNIIR